MKVLKFIARGVLTIFGLVVLFYLIVLAGNWNDQAPSAAALRADAIIAARPQVSARENAIVFLLGFSVPAGQDPYEIGARRLPWVATYADTTKLESDPLQDSIDLKSQGSPAVEQIVNECGKDDRKLCAQVFDGAAPDWQPTEMETLALQRYRTLLEHHAWRDVTPMHVSAPLPAYGGVIHAQRLYHLSMLQLARLGKDDAVRDGLNADLVYWRGAQRSAENLIAKMIAVAALRNHFFFSNLVLRRLPADRVTQAVPPEWQREFSADERSMHLVMAGELKFSQGMLHRALHAGDLVDTLAETEEPSTVGKWLDYLAKPMFKEQDVVNGIADRYMRLSDQFAVPMNQYPAVKLEIERYVRDHPQRISIYNPVGDYYLREVEVSTYADYAIRTANPEGMRRAALLVAQLRARGVAADAVAAELARATLREPYADAPFEWDPQQMAVVFTSPENHGWRRYEFFY